MADTCTCGGTMSGNCATGMRVSANSAGDRDDDRDDDREPRPVDKDRRDHWFASGALGASLGRGLAAPPPLPVRGLAGGGLAGPGDTASPGRTRCSPSLMTSSPSFSPLRHDGGGGRRLAELNAPTLRLVLRIDNVDVIALLVGQHRGARDGENVDRLHALEQHGHEFAVGQLARAGLPGVSCLGNSGLGTTPRTRNRVGVFGDRRRHIVELAFLPVDPPVRQAQLDHDRAEPALAA